MKLNIEILIQEETMKLHYSRHIASAFVILLAIVACVLPGQAAQPQSSLPPTANPFAIATAVAGTAQAAAAQTAQANPIPATEAPVLTETLPSAAPSTGKLKEEQSDGTTLFTDYDASYQITFPQGWTVIIPEKDDISQALNSIPEQEQNISKLIESAKNADTKNMIRVFGFNLKAQQGVYTPNINISYDTNPLLKTAPLKDVLNATVAYYPSMGIQVISSEVKQTSSGMEIGEIQTEWTMNVTGNQQVNLHQKQIFFKSGEGVAIITFSTVKNATVDLNGDVNKIIDSIQLLD